MASIRPIDQIAKKWATVTPQRSGDYQEGVLNPRTDWQTAANAASERWQQGVTEAIAQKRFGSGVRKAGTARWQKGAVEKGVNRWGQGVQLAQADYATAFAPFADAIKGLTLPQRYARRDPRNLARVDAVDKTMIATAQRLSGSAP